MGTSADRLGTAKISTLFIKLAIPTIIAQLVNVIYNMVDRIYIGRVPDSELAMSALAVSLPVVTLIAAFNSLLGFGGAPIAAMKLGEKDVDGANKILTTSFSLLTITAISITVIILLFQEPILYAFGADATNIELAKGYVGIYSLGTIFVLYAVGLNPYITTQGKSSLSMATVLIGAILNIILDPIFIFTFDMGVQGAAIATIIAQAVSAVWVMFFFFKGDSIMRIKREYLKPNLKIVGSIVALGISPFIMTSTEGLLQIAFNNQLKLYGGTLAVGTIAILTSIFTMLLMTVHGMTQGAQPILSYNLGAGNMDRVKKTLKLLFIVTSSFAVTSVSIIIFLPRFFAGIFADTEDAIRMVAWAIPPYFTGALTFGTQTACQQSFIALGEAKRSLLMAITRKIILLIPLIFIMPMLIGNLDVVHTLSEPVADLAKEPSMVFAILSAESVADVLSAIITCILFFCFCKTKLKDNKKENI